MDLRCNNDDFYLICAKKTNMIITCIQSTYLIIVSTLNCVCFVYNSVNTLYALYSKCKRKRMPEVLTGEYPYYRFDGDGPRYY